MLVRDILKPHILISGLPWHPAAPEWYIQVGTFYGGTCCVLNFQGSGVRVRRLERGGWPGSGRAPSGSTSARWT